jgi:hypothetical protein
MAKDYEGGKHCKKGQHQWILARHIIWCHVCRSRISRRTLNTNTSEILIAGAGAGGGRPPKLFQRPVAYKDLSLQDEERQILIEDLQRRASALGFELVAKAPVDAEAKAPKSRRQASPRRLLGA